MSKIKMKIAITGTIGSGKTEAANYIRKCGYDVFDCDETNAQILNNDAYNLLGDAFPECFVNKELNKKKLAEIVFSNKDKRIELENIMHPLILDELFKRQDNPLFAEVPLLFESGWDKYFDETILIVSDEQIAIERLENRGINKQEALNRIKNQLSVQEKIKKATIIIYNNGSLDELYSAINDYLKKIC